MSNLVPKTSVEIELGGSSNADRLTALEGAARTLKDAINGLGSSMESERHDIEERIRAAEDNGATREAFLREQETRDAANTRTVEELRSGLVQLQENLRNVETFDADDVRTRITRLSGAVEALENRQRNDTVNIGNLTGYEEGTSEFPRGLLAYVIEQYHWADVQKYLRSVEKDRREVETKAQG